jgi:diacylglycerol kinase
VTHKNGSFFSSFKNAIQGLRHLLVSEKNARFHLFASIVVITVGILLRITIGDWLWVCLAIFLVWITELSNTAIEKICDLVDPDFNPLIKISKDLSAAAVLLAAVFSVLVGIAVFLPRLLDFLRFL